MATIEGLSPRTQKAYQQTLYQLSAVSEGDEPTPEEIKKFLDHYGASSLQRHKAAINDYWDWRYPKERWPFGKRQFRKVHLPVPRYINPEVVVKVAEAGDKDDYWFVWTLFTLGCRISELMGILLEDITETGVRVLTKGGAYRLKLALPEFIRDFRKYAKQKVKNNPGPVFSEKYSHYYERLNKLAKKAGVDHISPHMLRHSRAVDLLKKGMAPAFVQQFLGHANFNTTARYLEITGGELHQELTKAENGAGNNGELKAGEKRGKRHAK